MTLFLVQQFVMAKGGRALLFESPPSCFLLRISSLHILGSSNPSPASSFFAFITLDKGPGRACFWYWCFPEPRVE